MESFVCRICGKTHEGLPTDQAFQLPDVVWAIPKENQSNEAKFTTDLCQYGKRFFIRCVLKVPFTEDSGYFGWGVWVEVMQTIFDRYLTLYSAYAISEPPHNGIIANKLPLYNESLGLEIRVQFGKSNERPVVFLLAEAANDLATDQRDGIDRVRYHEVLIATGAIEAAGSMG